MAKLFSDILKNAESKGIANDKTKESIDWFRNNIRKMKVQSSRLYKESKDNMVNSWTNVGPGRVYFVTYDPKHKKTLPYYDSFPCMIPLERYKDGLLAMNLHYLPPILRAQLLDVLYSTLSNDKMDESTKMKVNYSIMLKLSKNQLFKPCIKRYLGKHFRSRFIKIPANEWTPAVFLPVENFQKASKTKVWSDSRKIIRG